MCRDAHGRLYGQYGKFEYCAYKKIEIIKQSETIGAIRELPIKRTRWKSGNWGVIINQYKRICTIESRRINSMFGWQSRFYEHIIRNKKESYRVRKYIINNSKKWKGDRNYV